MIASLPMYDWPELRGATDAWWTGLRRHLGFGPHDLSRRADYPADWAEPSLLFSQTCGYPFTHAFRNRLTLVATPHYAADGCEGPNYRSFVFAREGETLAGLRGKRAAVNNPDSMSGMLALQLVFAPLAEHGRFFSQAIETGGHRASLQAVRDGAADVCAIDAVCVALARRVSPALLTGLVEIARSPQVPSLPYVTVAGDVAALRAALKAAFSDPHLQAAREDLLLTGFSELSAADYARITDLESAMQRQGGLRLL